MNADTKNARRGERGSALVIAVLVMVILTLLGISFLMMAETENRIAENEKLAAQALYAAETGVHQVKRWFDRPQSTLNLSNPAVGDVDRSLRLLDLDGDPGTAPTTGVLYKAGVDLDADSADDIFHKPYRGGPEHALLGNENNPDMRMVAGGTGDTYLAQLSTDLFGAFPGTGGLQARITQIDIYAPPYVQLGANWTRYGMGTVRVAAQIQDSNGDVLAERVVRAVFNEMPYPGPFGPLHSCDDMEWNGEFSVYWGPATAVGDTQLTNSPKKIKTTWPRVDSPSPRVDLLWGYNSLSDWNAYMAEVDGEEIEDPWFRYMGRGTYHDHGNWDSPTFTQPWPFDWVPPAATNPLQDDHWPNQNHGGGTVVGSHSNVFKNVPSVTCPLFDYETWKGIATSGTSDVHYYVWDQGTEFRENGFGANAQTYRTITHDRAGLFFFDTANTQPPLDTNGDGNYDNLTPEIKISGGTYQVRGMVYLNSEEFGTKGVTGLDATFAAPGEPYRDVNQNGAWDAGEEWVNMDYAADETDVFTIDTADTYGGGVVRNSRGPDFTHEAIVWGILYNNGHFNATGNATFYGSIITYAGVGEAGPSSGTPQIYWDQSIQDDWPPTGWDLPRVVITRFESDLRQ